MSKHTAEKWHLHDMETNTVAGADHIAIADCNARNRIEEENFANAKRIVHCVNNFDELVEALRIIKDSFWTDGEPFEERLEDVKNIAEQALKKAERRNNER